MLSNAFLSSILVTAIAVILSAVLEGKLLRTKKQLRDMEEALSEIRDGNGNVKILASQSDLIAPLAYKINAIVSSYEEQLVSMHRTDETNKQLMTSLSHDVRTPLTTLIGYLDAAHRGIVTGQERDDYIEAARKRAYDLKDYIDILFDWFKLNSNELAFTMKPIEVTEFTRNLLKDWIPVFEERDMEFNIDIPEQPCEIRLDEDGFTRVMNNLVQNVISHSKATYIEISIHRQGTISEISVSDNGIGIVKEDLPHIFDRLYKCDKGRSEKGSGLGLSITRQMVEKMKGNISVQSIPGKQTTFKIQFPIAS